MKIDYEITVNVEGLSHGEKKRVQDAFFKLGLTWWDGKGYSQLDKRCYTNKMKFGEVTQGLMWAYDSTKPTHTIDQLLELAGMKTKTDSIPFDLEKALAGDPVVMRNGREVTQVTLFECESRYPLCAVVDGDVCSFTKTGGHYDNGQPSQHDLFMKSKTRIINGFEVPAPETKAPEEGTTYYFPILHTVKLYGTDEWYRDEEWHKRCLKRGLVFLNKEDAIANAKAMLGIGPYGDDD